MKDGEGYPDIDKVKIILRCKGKTIRVTDTTARDLMTLVTNYINELRMTLPAFVAYWDVIEARMKRSEELLASIGAEVPNSMKMVHDTISANEHLNTISLELMKYGEKMDAAIGIAPEDGISQQILWRFHEEG